MKILNGRDWEYSGDGLNISSYDRVNNGARQLNRRCNYPQCCPQEFQRVLLVILDLRLTSLARAQQPGEQSPVECEIAAKDHTRGGSHENRTIIIL